MTKINVELITLPRWFLLVMALSSLSLFHSLVISAELPSGPLNKVTSPKLAQDEYQALFKKIFGHAQQVADNLLVPFYIGNRQYGKIVMYSANNSTDNKLSANTLVAQLRPFISDSIIASLNVRIDNEKKIPISVLVDLGFTARFDPTKLAFHINIPSEHRRIKTVSEERQRLPANYEYAIMPNNKTGFINFRTGYTVNHNAIEEINNRHAVSLNFDAAYNYKGFVSEGVFEYNKNTAWRRRDIRFIYDRPEKMLRYAMGDIHMPVSGFQTAPALGGISISKDFSLQPYALTRPVSSKELYISRPSTIEIYVNDTIVDVKQVEAGPYNYLQTALKHGAGDVKILIRDQSGEETWVDINSYYNVRGLKQGISQYSFNAGFLRTQLSSGYQYDVKKPVFSYYYRYGVSDALTIGGYMQTLLEHSILGMETSWSSFLGNINTNVAFSADEKNRTGTAIEIKHVYHDNNLSTNPYNRAWQFSLEYKSTNFSQLLRSEFVQTIPVSINGSVSQNLFPSLSGSFSASYLRSRDETASKNDYRVSMSVIKRLSKNSRLSFILSKQYSSSVQNDDWSGGISFTYNFPKSGDFVNSRIDSRDQVQSLNWQHNSQENNFSHTLATSRSQSTKINLSARGVYRGYRGDATITHRYDNPRIGAKRSSTNMTLNTSLLYADGHFGWSRVVNNSFAILKPNKELEDYTLGINKNNFGSFQGSSDDYGSAAITTLSPYQVYDLKVEIPQLPIGYNVNGFSHTLKPSYKSGYLINVNGRVSGMARGNLVDENQQPIAYVVGELVPLAGKAKTPVSFFTNKSGRFIVYGLSAGKYQVNIKQKSFVEHTIDVPDNCPSNFCRLGSITLAKKQGKAVFSENVATKAPEKNQSSLMPSPTNDKVVIKEKRCDYCEQSQSDCCQNKIDTLTKVTQKKALTDSVTPGSTKVFAAELSEAASDTEHSIEELTLSSSIDNKEQTILSLLSEINRLKASGLPLYVSLVTIADKDKKTKHLNSGKIFMKCMTLFNIFDDKIHQIYSPTLVQGINIKNKHLEKYLDRWNVWQLCSKPAQLD